MIGIASLLGVQQSGSLSAAQRASVQVATQAHAPLVSAEPVEVASYFLNSAFQRASDFEFWSVRLCRTSPLALENFSVFSELEPSQVERSEIYDNGVKFDMRIALERLQ